MKDRIFLIWSGNNTIAIKIKKILETEHNYLCYVGGSHENNSQMFSVGDTVVKEMNTCNQAIVLFQNKEDGVVSSNLFFELGYVSAKYGMKKVHCVKRENEKITLPSDFDNAFVEGLPCSNDDEYAENIVKYFLERQKLSVDENKMYLINNRYIIHEMLLMHYSSSGSKCSDYELAQYVLFYMQAAVMYQDERKVLDELREFKRQHFNEFSEELSESVNLSIALLEVQSDLQYDGEVVYLSDDAFRKYFNACKDMLDEIEDDSSGLFDEWAKAITSENLAYASSMYAQNPALNENTRNFLFQKTLQYGNQCLCYLQTLADMKINVENNDVSGIISVFRSYIYRHLFIAAKEVDKDNASKWLQLSIKERKSLLKNFDSNSTDTKIYNNFEMEYYLNLVEYLDYFDRSQIDEFDYIMYLNDIDGYISKIDRNDVHAFVNKIVDVRKKFHQ